MNRFGSPEGWAQPNLYIPFLSR